jgi:exo-beta-1,3-glucanase (GH17 family)
MRLPVGLFILVAAAIVTVWWRLGAPVPMPPSPLGEGEKLHCVSYAPFRGQQSPLDPAIRIDSRQIEDDLGRLRRLTGCVRTYSTRNGLDRVAEIAERHGVKVIQGIWLGGDRMAAERDLVTAVGLAQRHPQTIRSIVVGNEVLLRGEMSAAELAATIRRVKADVPAPVTYADVWEFWLRYRELHDAVDFVTIHILPYWEDDPIAARNAAAHVEAIRRRVAASLPGKEIFIGETGWPSAGRMRAGALPSPANQARVIHEVLGVAKSEGYQVNVIEAFDQPWKRQLEGTVGGHWGLLDAWAREPKFAWGRPVSNHPHWRLQAVGGVTLAALVFGAALGARREGAPVRPSLWFGVATIALAAGILIGRAVENVPLESLGAGDWIRSCAMVALAVVGPLLVAAALLRRTGAPAFADILARRAERKDMLAVLLGTALIVLSVVAVQVALGLAFDPRYKDFPVAPLTAATVPFLVLSLLAHVPAKPVPDPDRGWAPVRRQEHAPLNDSRARPDSKGTGQALGTPDGGVRGVAESAFAAVLAACTVYFVFNEGLANWQALWLGAVFMGLALSLFQVRAAPGSA